MEHISQHTSESWTGADEAIQQRIDAIRDSILSREEYQAILNEERALDEVQKERELTDDEVDRYYEGRQQIKKASVVAETIPEMRRTLELITGDSDGAFDTMVHENAHANKAEELGAFFGGYEFTVIREEDGSLSVAPRARVDIPEEWDLEKQNDTYEQILRAPDMYGHRVSSGDHEDLEYLKS